MTSNLDTLTQPTASINDLRHVESLFNELLSHYNRLIAARAEYLLPALSWAAYMRLQQEVPSFLVPVRQEYFKKFMLRYWFIKPKGYQEALMYLQAQLRAYLSNQGFFKEEEAALHRLYIQRSQLVAVIDQESTEILARLQSRRLSRPDRREPQADNMFDPANPLNSGNLMHMHHPLSPLNPLNPNSIADLLAGPDCQDGAEAREATVIATDDRLGYFS